MLIENYQERFFSDSKRFSYLFTNSKSIIPSFPELKTLRKLKKKQRCSGTKDLSFQTGDICKATNS